MDDVWEDDDEVEQRENLSNNKFEKDLEKLRDIHSNVCFTTLQY
jgi:hypothetical protein